jgi:para-aminobenzoate synthetase component I
MPLAVLLHSGKGGRTTGRYDIMAADPIRRIVYDDGTLCIGSLRMPTSQPFDALRDAFAVESGPAEAHFKSGFIGYFGYALQHAVERVPAGADDPACLPALSGADYAWSIVTDHLVRTTTLWYRNTVGAAELRRIKHVLTGEARTIRSFAIAPRYLSSSSEDTYRAAFARIKNYIDAGDCYQVNLARHYRADLRGDHMSASWAAYRRLAHTQPAPFSAYLTTPFGIIVSMSPERFLKFSECQVETAPIKGTAPRHEDPELDAAARDELANSPKDRAENLMIVDLLRNDLGRLCVPGTIDASDLFAVETFANVHHLVSTIRGVPRSDVDAWAALAAAFPGGSVTGAPKVRAMAIINELEPVGRSVYCGAVGYVDDSGAMDSNIAIRTLVFAPSGVHCWGGGGIVADSDVSQELAEIEFKINRMLQVTAALADSSSWSA